MKKTGSQIFVESLKMEKVDTLFCYPGGAVLNITDALYFSNIRQILVRHEQAAVHAADGYARASGRPGACLVTSGPGATNTVTGIATAYMDSVPLVVFSGQVNRALLGNAAFQEADITGITRPCTKHNYLVTDVKDMARVIKEAFYVATSGRPGPVLIDIPKDVSAALTEFDYPDIVHMRGYHPNSLVDADLVRKAIRVLISSSRPVFLTGGGIISSNATRQLRAVAERLSIPVVSTLMGLGGFPGSHPQFLGMVGMHGTYAANMAIVNSDLIIAVGTRFDDRATGKVDEFAPGAKIIHIDIDPTSISKNIRVDVPIVCDARDALEKILQLVTAGKPDFTSYSSKIRDWLRKIREWQIGFPLSYTRNGRLKPQHVVERICQLVKGKAIITTEVGQNQMWTAQFYKFDVPRRLLTSGGLGTMGFGFPAAIGAQMSSPEALVIDIAGDGSIQMNIQELATVVQYDLPVKVIILNNGCLGLVRQWQEIHYENRYAMSKLGCQPDFVKLAEAYGAVGYDVEREDELDDVLEKTFSNGKPTFVNVHVDPRENVYPFVPAGAPLNDMLLV
jgi:acetolactate synthase I/II/III large subunit